jgi:hypothetical protein
MGTSLLREDPSLVQTLAAMVGEGLEVELHYTTVKNPSLARSTPEEAQVTSVEELGLLLGRIRRMEPPSLQ